jgi:uncharacterized membrane protein SpoIIM required for sporulation
VSVVNQHVFSHGMRDTRETFEVWNEHPWTVLRGWLALSVAIALALLAATWFVAGFIAGASMPIAAARRRGFSRWIHVKAGELAILFVCAVTLFSLGTQALYLGFQGATLASQLEITRLELILSVFPHAIPELSALFLPLAAWLIASRRGEWNQLLAATFITVALAIPVLILAATVEVYVWPHILEALSPIDPRHITTHFVVGS